MTRRIDLAGGVGAAFTTRAGGSSRAPYDTLNLGGAVGDDPAAVLANRRATATALGLDPGRVVWMRQVHGADVAFVTAPWGRAGGTAAVPAGAVTRGATAGGQGTSVVDEPVVDGPVVDEPVVDQTAVSEPPAVDALVTTVPGLALAVLVADCAPVLLADPVAGVAGAAHSGRPGTLAGVVPALVARMLEHGAEPERVAAMVGPAACGSCYEVPEAMRAEFCAALPAAHATTRAGTPGLDIRAGIVAQLADAGVTGVQVDPRCTIESPELFSYRRDGVTGRFAGYVWLDGRS